MRREGRTIEWCGEAVGFVRWFQGSKVPRFQAFQKWGEVPRFQAHQKWGEVPRFQASQMRREVPRFQVPGQKKILSKKIRAPLAGSAPR